MKRNYLKVICENIASLAGILAVVLVFHVFVAKGSVIPTGSMADNLRGDHFHLTCPACGYEYNFGFNPREYRDARTGNWWPEGFRPGFPVPLTGFGIRSQSRAPECPMCSCPADTDKKYYVRRGDQIWVMKCYYQFQEPQRWDIAVLKNPCDPKIDYIKRIAGCPEETIEIIDGDIYADGQIQHKPPQVQDAMWIKLFDSQYQPANQSAAITGLRRWHYPFDEAATPSAWHIDAPNQRFVFDGSEQEQLLEFDPVRLKTLLAGFVPYNGPSPERRYYVSDLKLSCQVADFSNKSDISILLGKYGRLYRATVFRNGQCQIEDLSGQAVLVQNQCLPLNSSRPIDLAFENVDHRLTLWINDQPVLQYDGPNAAADWGYYNEERPTPCPTVALGVCGGPITLNHITLHRDTHYTNYPLGGNKRGRATEGYPITLKKDQFFVLGDNSPNSHDGRFWDAPDSEMSNGDTPPPAGIVPRDYLIGKPLFVYWPGAHQFNEKLPLPIIPNIGEMRFIH